MKLYLYYIGKPRDAHANSIAEDFMERISRYTTAEMREIRPDRFDLWARHPAARKILLDPGGRDMDSAGFVRLVEKSAMEGRDLLLLIGGAEGLPSEWKTRADLLLALSRMTFPHELARAMLAEQIYRAFATLRGHPYPR